MMKLKAALISMCLLGLAACGGGDKGEAGSPTAFSTVPDEITLSGPNADTCGGGFAGRVFIYGGAAPYRIDNTHPLLVAVSRKTVDNRTGGDAYFDVTYLTSACMDNIQLVVTDALDKKVEISLSSIKGED